MVLGCGVVSLPSNELIAHVALPVALAAALRYRVPPELAPRLEPGHRVRVPLRGRQAHGLVLAVRREPPDPEHALRAIEALDPDEVLIDQAGRDLVAWVARYYAAPIGIAVEAAVPRAVARPPRAAQAEHAERDAQAEHAERSAQEELTPPVNSPPLVLNPDQAAALACIAQALDQRAGTTFLLQGVTGSGKTEVYLQAIAATLERGQRALLLVPEIALGTQVVQRVRERFGDRVVEYHSQLRPAARRRAWWRARRGTAQVVVGARSAVFVPLADLGLIVIDEEHEPSYKQTETPRYHGRDTALVRARHARAVAILGSATPSLESRRNAETGKYERLLLPQRIAARPPATVTLADLRTRIEPEEAAQPIPGVHWVPGGDREPGAPLADYLLVRLRATLAAGDQAILFLNRRGHSTAVQCRACGFVFECRRCSVVLTYHRTDQALRCHYCNHREEGLARCPECGGHDFAYTGIGTQKVEAALTAALPEARILRMDFDSTRKRGALATIIGAFERGEADILLGTQMVAKGLDFPHVTLVGVVSADREMGLPDFRAGERAFQLLTQVAGRAGRGAKPGEVIFQTYLPQHHTIQAAGRQDYELFYERELGERSALGYPPFRRMANLLFDGPEEPRVIALAEEVADRLASSAGIDLLGPAPMPLSRLKGQFRWHLTLVSAQPQRLVQTLHEVLAWSRQRRPRGNVRIQADMDPVSLM